MNKMSNSQNGAHRWLSQRPWPWCCCPQSPWIPRDGSPSSLSMMWVSDSSLFHTCPIPWSSPSPIWQWHLRSGGQCAPCPRTKTCPGNRHPRPRLHTAGCLWVVLWPEVNRAQRHFSHSRGLPHKFLLGGKSTEVQKLKSSYLWGGDVRNEDDKILLGPDNDPSFTLKVSPDDLHVVPGGKVFPQFTAVKGERCLTIRHKHNFNNKLKFLI